MKSKKKPSKKRSSTKILTHMPARADEKLPKPPVFRVDPNAMTHASGLSKKFARAYKKAQRGEIYLKVE